MRRSLRFGGGWLAVALLAAATVARAETPEVLAFDAAGASFRDGFYARAEAEFGQL